MQKLLLLLLIIGIKILSTKGLSLLIVLISFFFKGKSLHFNTEQWNLFFKDIKEKFILKSFKIIYTISTLLSSIIAYILFSITHFKYPLVLSIVLLLCSITYTWVSYRNKTKRKLISACDEIKKSVKSE